MPSERFCLKWKDFESNSTKAFHEIREDQDFLDVTLSCGDEQIQAHKVIISACSPFFRDVLRKNPHAHPLLYLKGVKYTHLQSLLTYMYCGEVTLAEEDLTSFLAVAQELKVKGLTMDKSVSNTPSRPHTAPQLCDPVSPPKKPDPSFTPKQENEDIREVPTDKTESLQCSEVTAGELQYQAQSCKQEQCQGGLQNQYQEDQEYQEYQDGIDHQEPHYEEPYQEPLYKEPQNQEPLYQEPLYEEPPRDRYEEAVEVPVVTLVARPNNNYEEHGKTIDSLIQRLADGNLICKECGKEERKGSNYKRNMVSHIESHHMEGISHPCNKCEKYFRTKSSLATHMSRTHKKK